MNNYPMGVKDSDFHMRNAHGAKGRVKVLPPPSTTMVYCPPCGKHWEAPARTDYWNARVELCPEHSALNDEDLERVCGRPDDPWPSQEEMESDASQD